MVQSFGAQYFEKSLTATKDELAEPFRNKLKGKAWDISIDDSLKEKKGVTLRAPSNNTIAAIVQIHPIGDGGKFVIGNTEPLHGTIGFNTSEDAGHLTLWTWEHKYDFYVIGEVTVGWLITT